MKKTNDINSSINMFGRGTVINGDIEAKSDIDCRPLDKIIVNSYQNLIVQKITITQSRAELHCIVDTGELKKAIQTKKKLKKALGDDDEPIQG